MIRNLVLPLTIFLSLFCPLRSQVLQQPWNKLSQDLVIVTMAAPHFETEPAYLALEGRNLGPHPEVFLGSVAGSMEPLNVLASSENFIDAELPEILPGTFLVVISSGKPGRKQMFALYVSLNPPSQSFHSEGMQNKRESAGVSSTRYSSAKPRGASDRLPLMVSGTSTETTGTEGLITSLDPPRPIPFALVPKWEESGTDIYYTAGYVGIGVTTPEAPLHVYSSDSIQKVIHAESAGPEIVRNLMVLKNNGMAQFKLVDSSPNGDAWQFSNTDSGFNISLQGSGVQEFLIENSGKVFLSGQLNATGGIHVTGNITSDGEICIGSGC